MRTPDSIPLEVRRKQSECSDPEVSAWVAANAGAGKTYVLAQRVISLLLKGVEPEKIHCITLTGWRIGPRSTTARSTRPFASTPT